MFNTIDFAVAVPTEGPEALTDRVEDVPVFRASQTAAE